MKKLLIPLFVAATLSLAACNDQNQTATTVKSQAQTSEEKNLQNFPALHVKDVTVFDKDQVVPVSLDGVKTESHVNTFVNLSETQVPWLNELLISKQYEEGLNYFTEFTESSNQNSNEDLKANATPSKQNLMDLFAKIHKHSIESVQESGSIGSELVLHMSYIGQRNNLVTFRNDIYTYSGGAHGLQIGSYLNINVEKQSVISLDDIIDKKDQPTLLKALWEIYSNLPENSDGTFTEKQDFTISPQFYFDQNGINFIYPPYALFPFVYGETRLTLPWDSDEANLIKLKW